MRLIKQIFLTVNLAIFSFNAFLKPISIRSTSDLEFGVLVQGDGAKSIAPGTTDTIENASYVVSGDKSATYTIILPASASISLDGTGANPITLSGFTSFPAEGANGQLDNKGKQDLLLGATLSAIPFNQPAGDYTGDFIIDVIY